MNLVQRPPRLDKQAFLDQDKDGRERFELVQGHAVMMPRPSRAHATIIGNLVVALRRELDPGNWSVIAEFGLDTGPDMLRYPDVVVDRAGGAANDYWATAPSLVIEVLSPSTAAIDLGDKAAEYLPLATLAAYLVFAQDERKAWIWLRSETGFRAGPSVVGGDDAAVEIAVLGITLSLRDVYANVPIGGKHAD